MVESMATKEVFVLKRKSLADKETKTVGFEIHDFTGMIEESKNKSKIQSPIKSPNFKIGEKKLYITIYPDLIGNGYISVYLCNPNKEEVKVSYTLKHESGAKGTYEEKDLKVGQLRGPLYMSHVNYKKWAEDHGDVFKVEAEVTLHEQDENTEPKWEIISKKRKVAPEFDVLTEVSSLVSNDNHNDRLFTDFSIKSKEGKVFPCHRVILASQSPVMKAMMTNDMREKQEDQAVVKHGDEVVGHFVEYFYSRTVPEEALRANLANFFDLADFYHLAQLKLITEEAAFGMLSVENMVDLFVLGDLHSAALKSEAEAFIKRNRKELKGMDLSAYPPHVLNELLRLLI